MNKSTKENKRAKEVEPDGLGEATCSHELYLHELASIGSAKVVPQFHPTRLGHGGLKSVGVRSASILTLSPQWPHPRARNRSQRLG